jgi:DNA-binding CsgD family transcriptional regulator
LSAQELDEARKFGAPRAIGIAMTVAGILERASRGRVLLERAVDVLRGAGAPLEHARAEVELGSVLRRAGRRTAARDALRRGLDTAHRCGSIALVNRAREELVALGFRPRRPAFTGPDALTPAERRVAMRAAAGRTNREIAQDLFVTRRTVETHLKRAYEKLGVTTRGELAEALR